MIQAPPSWTVHLVDNAGFGEAGQEGIIKQATTALVTSSAYVYIMSYENLGDSKDVAAFQKIYHKDRGQNLSQKYYIRTCKWKDTPALLL